MGIISRGKFYDASNQCYNEPVLLLDEQIQ